VYLALLLSPNSHAPKPTCVLPCCPHLRQVTVAINKADLVGPEELQQVLDQVRQQVAVVTPPPFNRFQHSFSHIFAGGYASGYYGYKWAEVLDADAFSVFKEKGLFNKEVAKSFRENILERGGTEHPMILYKRFRGQEPTVDALLERSGLK